MGIQHIARILGVAALTALSIGTLSCNEHGVVPLNENLAVERTDTVGTAGANKVDILWVVDNSGSMCEEQANLRENFDQFITGLVDIGADFNLAVVTTDMQDPNESGRFQNIPDGDAGPSCSLTVDISQCPSPANGQDYPPLVISSQNPRYKLPDGTVNVESLKRDFGCNATTGTKGNGFEMGLEAAKVALDLNLRQSFNSGFLRDDAFLAVIFLTDENDCSDRGRLDKTNGNVCEWFSGDLVPAQEYVNFFAGLKGGALDRVIMAGIIAPDTGVRYMPGEDVSPSCISNFGEGYGGYRYQEVISAFPSSQIANICQPPFSEALAALSELIVEAVDNRCLDAEPLRCATASDCASGQTCAPRGMRGQLFCSGFKVQVEIERPAAADFTDLAGRVCESTGANMRCVLQEGVDFNLNYDNLECTRSNISVELTKALAPTDQLLVRYPRKVDLDGNSGQPATEQPPAEQPPAGQQPPVEQPMQPGAGQ